MSGKQSFILSHRISYWQRHGFTINRQQQAGMDWAPTLIDHPMQKDRWAVPLSHRLIHRE
jgi:hypothetical protein